MALCVLGVPLLECPQEQGNVVFSRTPFSSQRPPSLLFTLYVHFFIMGIKRPAHEVDHSFPWGANGKNEWSPAAAHPLYFKGITRTSYCTSLSISVGQAHGRRTERRLCGNWMSKWPLLVVRITGQCPVPVAARCVYLTV